MQQRLSTIENNDNTTSILLDGNCLNLKINTLADADKIIEKANTFIELVADKEDKVAMFCCDDGHYINGDYLNIVITHKEPSLNPSCATIPMKENLMYSPGDIEQIISKLEADCEVDNQCLIVFDNSLLERIHAVDSIGDDLMNRMKKVITAINCIPAYWFGIEATYFMGALHIDLYSNDIKMIISNFRLPFIDARGGVCYSESDSQKSDLYDGLPF